MKHIIIIILLLLTSSYCIEAQNENKHTFSTTHLKKARALSHNFVSFKTLTQIPDPNFSPQYSATPLPYKFILKNKKAAIRETYSHWRFGINTGVGFQLARASKKLSADMISRKKNMRLGYFVETDAGHFISENIGFGLKYNIFLSSNKMDNFSGNFIYYPDFSGKISDNLYVHYIGPLFLLRSVNWNKTIQTNCDLSFGYTIYNNKSKLNNETFNIIGGNFSFSSNIGVDFMINRKCALGFNVGILAASIKSIKANGFRYDLNQDQIENVSRVNFGIALRLY